MSRSGHCHCHCCLLHVCLTFLHSSAPQDNSECLWCQITGVRWHKLSEIMTSSGNITIISRNYLHNISCCVMAGSIHWASICLQSTEWISDPEEIFYCVNPLIGPLTFLFVSRIPERLTRSIFVRYRSVFTLSLFTRANGLSRISLWWARKSQRAQITCARAQKMLPGWRRAQDWKPGLGRLWGWWARVAHKCCGLRAHEWAEE